MSIKNNLTKTARKVLPKSALVGLEKSYRKSRAKIISARYGNPARDLRVIAVTGTNGKTTTVNFLNEILKEAGYKTAMFSLQAFKQLMILILQPQQFRNCKNSFTMQKKPMLNLR